MTVVATNTRELDIGSIIRLARQTAGLMPLEGGMSGPQWTAAAEYGRSQLELILDVLQTDTPLSRHIELYTTTVSAIGAGSVSAPITLPADTIDVTGDIMYKPSGENVESTICRIDRETWHGWSDKTISGRPTMYYLQRAATLSLYLLPIPDEAGATLRIQRQKLLADSSSTTATPDLERYWADYLHWELGYRFAVGVLPAERVGFLRSEARRALQMAQSKGRPQEDNQAYLRHPTQWHGR